MRGDQYVLNHCTVYLVRRNADPRHDYSFGHFAEGDSRARLREASRFPIVDSCSDPPGGQAAADFNDAAFVYPNYALDVSEVSVVGTFAKLHQPLALRRIKFLGEPTGYLGASVTSPEFSFRRVEVSDRSRQFGAAKLDVVALGNSQQLPWAVSWFKQLFPSLSQLLA